jgi:FKBP-type peptidyl-prolyl cis-trans isomerase
MKLQTIGLVLSITLAVGMSSALACKDHHKAADPTPEKTAMTQPAEAKEAIRTVDGIRIEDVTEGAGEEAHKGQKVTVNYTGTFLDSGEKFDSSYDHDEPFKFKLGAGQVIEGWDKGIAGMKVGGKRILVVPPDKAYGAEGYPPVIPPNATLKFEVELLGVQ